MKVKEVKTETRGGKRPGAGRHKVTDPKKPVTFYIKESIIKSYANIHEFTETYKSLFIAKIKKEK